MNKDLLNEFTEYCNHHSDESFWRCLLGWIQTKHDSQFTRLFVYKNKHLYDTFNWTGEDNPMVLFKDDVTINVIEKKD